MFDNTGSRYHFSVAAGVADRVLLVFSVADSDDRVDLSDSTWQFRLADASGSEVAGCSVEHGEAAGELVLMLPALGAGAYGYELFSTDAAGEMARVCYGTLTAMTSDFAQSLVQAAASQVTRVLNVIVPRVNAARLELRWRSCSAAEAAAAEAAAVVGNASAAADEARQEADRARTEADRATAAADGVRDEVQSLVDRAEVAVGAVEAMEGRLDAIDQHIRDSVVPNAVTNTWWIAGVDTHYQVTGDPGMSPYLSNGFWMVYDDAIHEWVNTGINARGEDGRCPIIGSNGNWLHWSQTSQSWEDSGVRAAGRDGLDGTAVRRIVVPAVDDIPPDGETCNGGFYYYVPLAVAHPVAVLDVLDAAAGELSVNGVAVSYAAQADREGAAEALAAAARVALAGLPEFSAVVDGSCVTLEADVLGWTFAGLDAQRYDLTEHVRMVPLNRYEVYAWLESPDGSGAWHCVGEANDLATTEIYGLVKTATDVVVHDGAPVGNNARGQLCVPVSSQVQPGTVRISFPDVMDDGALVGFDASGRLRVELATSQIFGAVMLSYSGDQMTNAYGTIGLRSDGKIGVRWATLEAPGVVRLGSSLGQINRIPYQQGVGATADHQIANNILFRGALLHQKLPAWLNQSRMPWLEELDSTISDDERKYLNTNDYYFGLYTSIQFEQGEENGLVLLPATNTLLAGVYVASSMDDLRDTGVPNAQTVKQWSVATHYLKSETYSKGEVDDLLAEKASLEEMRQYQQTVNDAITSHNKSVSQTLNSYDSYIRNQLFTKTEFAEAKEEFMTRTENWHGSVVMSENEYNSLRSIDSKVMYFLTDEE